MVARVVANTQARLALKTEIERQTDHDSQLVSLEARVSFLETALASTGVLDQSTAKIVMPSTHITRTEEARGRVIGGVMVPAGASRAGTASAPRIYRP